MGRVRQSVQDTLHLNLEDPGYNPVFRSVPEWFTRWPVDLKRRLSSVKRALAKHRFQLSDLSQEGGLFDPPDAWIHFFHSSSRWLFFIHSPLSFSRSPVFDQELLIFSRSLADT